MYSLIVLQYIEKCLKQAFNVSFLAIIQIKNPSIFLLKDLRGFDQIRTGVGGFADLCLAARPRNHYLGLQSYKKGANKKGFCKRILKF